MLAQWLDLAMCLKDFSSVKAGALAKIARKYAAAGQYDMAFVITEAMMGGRPSDKAWAKAGIAEYFAHRGDFKSAFPMALSIERRQIKLVTLGELLIEYAAAPGTRSTETQPQLHRIIHELG